MLALWIFYFRHAVIQVLGAVRDGETRRFLSLATLGLRGSYGPALVRDFRLLGILHLLVLSGLRVGAFARSLRRAFLFLSRRCPARFRGILCRGGMLAGFFVFGAATGWPAAITRALSSAAVSTVWPRLRRPWLIVFALALQLSFFPGQISESGFYLSWLCFLCLLWSHSWPVPALVRLAFLSLACQFVCVFILRLAAPTPREMAVLMVANVALGFLVETVLMPGIGCLLTGAFLWGALELFLAPAAVQSLDAGLNLAAHALVPGFFEGLARVVLVAKEGLLYIS